MVPPRFPGVTPIQQGDPFFYSGLMTTSTLSNLPADSTADSSFDAAAPTDQGGTSATNAAPESLPPASVARPQRTLSILALSLGIASFFFAQSVVVPLAAIVLGVFGLRDEPSGRSFSIWGIVLAIVATFGWVVIVVAGAVISLPFLLLAAL